MTMRWIPISILIFLSLLSASVWSAGDTHAEIQWKLEKAELNGTQGELLKLKITGTIPKGWHTYPTKAQDATQETVFSATPESLLKVEGLADADAKPTLSEEKLEIFENTVTFIVPIRILPSAPVGEHHAELEVLAQLCDAGSCLIPKSIALALKVTVRAGTGVSIEPTPPVIPPKIETAPVVPKATAGANSASTQDDFSKAQEGGLWNILWLAMAAGAGALLTPCVFPMIPITVSFFTKRKQATRGRALRDALFFSAGIIFTFTGLGLFCALAFGAASVQNFASNPWVNLLFASIFIALALSLLGAFEIQIPSFITNKLNAQANRGEGVGSVLLMGLVFALTSFTCTGPFVGGVLVAAANGNWMGPLVGMFGFATAFAAPFFVLSLFPSLLKSMPKSGGWLNSVKVVMGFLEIAAALKFISNADYVWQLGLLTREVFLAGWIAIALMTTLYLLGVFLLSHDTPVENIGALRAIFATFFVSVAIWLGAGLMGAKLGDIEAYVPPRDYPASRGAAFGWMNLKNTSDGSEAQQPKEEWIEDWDEGLAKAALTGKPVFVDFTGFSCTNCRLMEENIFPQPEIQKRLKHYVLVRLYTDDRRNAERVTRNAKNLAILQERYHVAALPYYAILNSDGTDIATFNGYNPDASKFAEFLQKGVKLQTK